MSIEYDIFKKSKLNNNKLLDYGFKKEKDYYIITKDIMNNCMKVEIKVKDEEVSSKVIDKDFNEEYTGFRNDNKGGTFSNKVKEELEEILIDIREKCSKKESFIFDQSNRLEKYIKEKYKDIPSFEWETSPNFGVFRNKDTKKWYALVMNIDKSKLNKDESGEVEIVNIKLDENEIVDLLKKDGFYPAWHMNKKYWISILLNDTIDDKVLFELIDESYNYSKKK